jgi:hypothetical protein
VSALEKTFTRPEAAVPSPTHIMYWLLIYWSCVYSSWFPKPLLLTKANTVSQLLYEPFCHLFLARLCPDVQWQRMSRIPCIRDL